MSHERIPRDNRVGRALCGRDFVQKVVVVWEREMAARIAMSSAGNTCAASRTRPIRHLQPLVPPPRATSKSGHPASTGHFHTAKPARAEILNEFSMERAHVNKNALSTPTTTTTGDTWLA